jgi:hypothetical protein
LADRTCRGYAGAVDQADSCPVRLLLEEFCESTSRPSCGARVNK